MAQELKLIATADVNDLVKGANTVKKELTSTAVAAKKLDQSLAGIKPGANQATNAMTNLGRVVQDAPFGIIGITNNINPLLESFQRLKNETGSTGGALKALAGSLIGAGGLGLAVSVVTSLLTVFALNNRSAGESTKEHKEKIDETKKAADQYASAISAASSAVISHQGKLTELNTVLRDTSNNFNVLSKNIINQALAEYLATQKEGLIKNILDAKVKEILAAQSAFSKVREFTDGLFSTDPLKRQIAESTADVNNLNNLVNSLGLDSIFGKIFELDKIKVKPKKIEVDTPEKFNFKVDTPEKFNFKVDKAPLPVLNIKPKVLIAPSLTFINNDAVSKDIVENIQGLINAAKIGEILSDSINQGISSAASSFADILTGTTSGLDGLFSGLANILGSGLKLIGQYLVKTYLLIGVIEKIKFSNPAVGVAVGFALQVLGAIVQSTLRKTPAFATGVRNFTGGTALVGERGPELVTLPIGSGVVPNGQLNAMGGAQVFIPELVIRGTDLVAVFKKASAQNSRNGF